MDTDDPEGGFITLHRVVRKSWLWRMPSGQTKVALTLLLMANWREGKTFSGGKVVIIQRGQCMTSLESIARESGETFRTVRTSLLNLGRAGFLTSKSTNKFRIITILNYDKYQDVSKGDRQADRQASDKLATSNRQASDNDRTIEPENQGTKEPSRPTEVTSEMLESLYQRYPCRNKKKDGLDKLKKIVKNRAQFNEVEKCVDAMARDWSGEDTQYCPGWLPFVNGRLWEDDEWPSPGKSRQQSLGRPPERIL